MLTLERKRELLGICRDIGQALTRLEGELHTEQIAIKQTEKARRAFETVRILIALQGERSN